MLHLLRQQWRCWVVLVPPPPFFCGKGGSFSTCDVPPTQKVSSTYAKKKGDLHLILQSSCAFLDGGNSMCVRNFI